MPTIDIVQYSERPNAFAARLVKSPPDPQYRFAQHSGVHIDVRKRCAARRVHCRLNSDTKRFPF